jgi:hypothetical protein
MHAGPGPGLARYLLGIHNGGISAQPLRSAPRTETVARSVTTSTEVSRRCCQGRLLRKANARKGRSREWEEQEQRPEGGNSNVCAEKWVGKERRLVRPEAPRSWALPIPY